MSVTIRLPSKAKPQKKEKPIPPGWTKEKFDKARDDLFILSDPTPSNICYGDGYYAKSLEQRYGMSISELEKIVGRVKFKSTWSWE